jgi:membrane-bound metal-dependent hydrolase YbcI (DUF457 family)
MRPCTRSGWIWLIGSLFFSLAPDLDAIPGVLAGDFRAFHNQWTHSLLVGLAVALVTGVIARWRKAPAGRWFLMALIGYSLHIGLDFFTRGGRGIMLFWPVTSQRFIGPFELFYGVRWSAGLWDYAHLVTFGTEFLFVAVIFGLWYLFERRQKTRRVGRAERLQSEC